MCSELCSLAEVAEVAELAELAELSVPDSLLLLSGGTSSYVLRMLMMVVRDTPKVSIKVFIDVPFLSAMNNSLRCELFNLGI